ncbi:bifunctional phosphoribosyl-AMP cyclohydrolase/phosphoribosyl-ATP diphosphatase HisIE [Butyrivibrio sp. VCB2006]|uniref:bifunctional phosphoribosyl-AMP cyclohydrolase/phosphoribosyl-ATP diphosphatase HisIE n=1 Tax=Butyrivibrio sp. VCB2006 TaxID=1280679 RepID=UPI0018CAE8F3|nr:bifunctional phosphoribosyl-AMP cyclohydrolase/phosphoribosyl-ATP diphosphatase HisIE [Butyrivibrio sp. VCB2006]
MFKKRFLASIYLKDEKAVKSLTDSTVICDDPASLASEYSNGGIDEIIVFDLSANGNDKAHEKALDIIKDICKASDVPVVGAGNVKRMEDIKKLLYAGCKKACLNFSKEGNVEILKEVSDKFGKDKIVICFSDSQSVTDNKDEICKYAGELICVRFEGLDKTVLPEIGLPVTVLENNTSIEKPYLLFSDSPVVYGISGDIINQNIKSISDYKETCIDIGIDINRLVPNFSFADLKKNSDGMVPVIVQDYRTDQVLMLAYMNEEAYNKTLRTGKMTYFSRSRNELWIKGETSSHYQYVMSLTADCDLDTILAKVKQIGVACHTGSYSCFFNEIASKDYSEKNPQKVLDNVFGVIQDRKVNPREGSYTNYLFDKGLDKILKKVGEEATEMVIAAKNEGSNEIVYEMSDFLYHMMVLMAEKNVSWEEITDELSRR